MASNTLERTGVIQDDATGETYIPASRRPDGTWRKPRRVKDGFIPQEEMPVYENKGVQWLKSKPSLPPGLDPGLAGKDTGSSQTSTDNMSKAARKKAKRKENKKKQQEEGNQSATSIQNVTNSLAGVQIDKDQSGGGSKQSDQSECKANDIVDKQDLEKKLKNLRKKLKQIEGIEKKIQSGELKNPQKDQLEKVSKKQAVIEEIEDLELEVED